MTIAQIIGSDRDELLALAGRVSSDLQTKIMKQPRAMARLIREFSEASRGGHELAKEVLGKVSGAHLQRSGEG